MPFWISRFTYVLTSFWYAAPPYCAGTSAAPGGRGGGGEPALLVERHPYGADLPGAHGRDRGLVHRAVPEPVALDAGELAPGAVDAEQPVGGAGRGDQLVARDLERRGGARRGRG